MAELEHKVFVTVDDVVYAGRRSVTQIGDRVWIDGREAGVECDNFGDPLVPSVDACDEPTIVTITGWQRLGRWFRAFLGGAS